MLLSLQHDRTYLGTDEPGCFKGDKTLMPPQSLIARRRRVNTRLRHCILFDLASFLPTTLTARSDGKPRKYVGGEKGTFGPQACRAAAGCSENQPWMALTRTSLVRWSFQENPSSHELAHFSCHSFFHTVPCPYVSRLAQSRRGLPPFIAIDAVPRIYLERVQDSA